MQNTNTVTSNATLTPEARAVVAAGHTRVGDLTRAVPVIQAIRNTYKSCARERVPEVLVSYCAGIAEGKHLERQRRADARPLHYTDDTGSRAPLTICEAQQYIDRATLTGDDLTAALHAITEAVKQDESIYLEKVTNMLHDPTLTEREKAIACATFFTGFAKAFLMIMQRQEKAIEEITANNSTEGDAISSTGDDLGDMLTNQREGSKQ